MGLYSIFKKLFLGDVEEITLDEEKVLVRGEDGVVKSVDKSSFGGGGGSGTLQSVLDAGKTWFNNTSGLKFFTVSDPANGNVFSWQTGTAGFTVTPNAADGSSVFNMTGGVNNGDGNEDNKGVSLVADTPESNTSYRFKLPVDLEPNGDHVSEHTLAVREDLSLQKITDGGSETTNTMTVLYTTEDEEPITFRADYGADQILMENPGVSTGLVYSNGMEFVDEVGGKTSGLFPDLGLRLKQDGATNQSVFLRASNLGSDLERVQELQDKDGTVALLEDVTLTLSNNTTTALSSSDLDTAYPDAKTGDKIHCTDILTGAVIYKKTEAGWFQYNITAVI